MIIIFFFNLDKSDSLKIRNFSTTVALILGKLTKEKFFFFLNFLYPPKNFFIVPLVISLIASKPNTVIIIFI